MNVCSRQAEDEDEDWSSAPAAGTCRAFVRQNELASYAADVFGLNEATRDCRLEMVEIIQEVSFDPIPIVGILTSLRRWVNSPLIRRARRVRARRGRILAHLSSVRSYL